MKVYCILATNDHYHDELVSIRYDEQKADNEAYKLNNKRNKVPNRTYYVEGWRVKE